MKIFWRILSATLGLFLAKEFIPGVKIAVIYGKTNYFGLNFTQDWQMVVFLGVILGLINMFVKPILNLISLPLRILTLGFFSLIINIGIIWALDFYFPEFKIEGLTPLLLTTLIILVLDFLLR
jgi:putative membrane protein